LASDRMTRETGNEQVECLERWIVLEPSMKRSFNKVDESDETGRRISCHILRCDGHRIM